METFDLVFVCTGNRFRSPLAAAFVRRLTVDLPVTVESYGTLPAEGSPAEPEAVEIALACGVSLEDHRSRSLDNVSLRDVDLLLGFEPAHVRHAVVDAEAPRELSFTLGDFVSLLDPVPADATNTRAVERARAQVQAASSIAADLTDHRSKSMSDPYGGPWQGYRDSAIEIRSLCLTLVDQLFGLRPTDELAPVPAKLRRRRKLLRR